MPEGMTDVGSNRPRRLPHALLHALSQEAQERLAAQVVYPPRLGGPSEPTDAVRFVIENQYVNGEAIRLDGAPGWYHVFAVQLCFACMDDAKPPLMCPQLFLCRRTLSPLWNFLHDRFAACGNRRGTMDAFSSGR